MTRGLTVSVMLALPLATLTTTASARGLDPPPTLATNPGPTINPDGWHLLFGQAYRDTVRAGTAAALLASAAALQSDHWVLVPYGAPTHLLSSWKPIHHILFRLFSGKAFGRIFIDVTPLTDGRSVTRFQGVLATRRDILHNPARSWAEKSYAKAVRQWQTEVLIQLQRMPMRRQD